MSRSWSILSTAIADGFRQLVSRPVYAIVMFLIPLGTCLFFLDLMNEGLPLRVPSAIVDLDNTPVSRNVARNLGASELVDVQYRPINYDNAMELLKGGKIFGFFMIPRDFQRNAESGREAAITYFCNMTYFIPGTLSYKGFKTTAVSTSGNIAATTLVGVGLDQKFVGSMLQPVVVEDHPLGNPWINYSIYLSNSFVPCMLQLVVFLMTTFTVLEEIKRGTSPIWISRAGGSMLIAVLGKLVPQFLAFASVGVCIQSLLYGYWGFPLQGSAWAMVLAMMLMVLAAQAFALFLCCLVPNLRIVLSIVSLLGILSFSIAGFSFPVEDMYGYIGVLSYLLPIRYYFLIYINVALNGFDVVFCRWDFIALMLFPPLSLTMLWRLKRYCLKPVYVP